ncbi:Dyp-type peroxidase [Rothia sp. ZJ932]|uniref:Dyp-type peroxidase n=1 Tax=Rothia sp. ZJ932 TaxID=2810516 RepID=UPI001F07E107|nr:Dyp-type peroxidase [Rothia sp. ZJ932]
MAEQTPDSLTSSITSRSTTRRAVVGVGLGAVALATAACSTSAGQQEEKQSQSEVTPLVDTRVAFYGKRQAGIDTPAQAHAVFIALDLCEGTNTQALIRLMRVLTADAAKLCAGEPSLVDQEPELAAVAANLTVTFGFGEKIFDIAAPAAKPQWLKPLPAFDEIDRLEDAWNDGDLLLQLCANDRMTLAHAQRTLLKGARPFVTVRWVQDGFLRAHGSEKPGETPRNLFGQVDGTVNPRQEDGTIDRYVWGENVEGLTPWVPGGTSLVIRRIHMNLDTWDLSDRPAREDAVGRKLSNGAPLTGEHEHDKADLEAVNELGFEVIAPYAHIRRAAPEKDIERILRRPYNYDLPVAAASGISQHGDTAGGISQSGLIFCSYQVDPLAQFVPIQRRLATLDMLNTWTVPIGSAVFALPPGCAPGQYIGQQLFEG